VGEERSALNPLKQSNLPNIQLHASIALMKAVALTRYLPILFDIELPKRRDIRIREARGRDQRAQN
jgi:hypothetical protein